MKILILILLASPMIKLWANDVTQKNPKLSSKAATEKPLTGAEILARLRILLPAGSATGVVREKTSKSWSDGKINLEVSKKPRPCKVSLSLVDDTSYELSVSELSLSEKNDLSIPLSSRIPFDAKGVPGNRQIDEDSESVAFTQDQDGRGFKYLMKH